MSLSLLSALFLGLTAAAAAFVAALFWRCLQGSARAAALIALAAWLLYAGGLGYSGLVALRMPPGPAFLMVPVVLFVARFLARHPGARDFALCVPLPLILGAQVFRLGVEFGLHGLYQNGLIPKMLTYEGANLDILVGLSAPVVAWLSASDRIAPATIRLWNVAGIVLLFNVIVRSVLSFAGALPGEAPNVAIGLFPFTFLPGFLAPLALCLHVLALRALPWRGRAAQGGR